MLLGLMDGPRWDWEQMSSVGEEGAPECRVQMVKRGGPLG